MIKSVSVRIGKDYMSVRQGPVAAQRAEKGRLHKVLSAGQEQQRLRAQETSVKSATGGGPYFYVGQGERGCKGGVYCDGDGKAVEDDGKKTSGEIRRQQPPNEVLDYIRQVQDNPPRWTGNGQLMLFPRNFSNYDGTPFKVAYAQYDIEQPAASQRGAAHATTLRAKDGSSIGTVTSLEGEKVPVTSLVVQGYFVDGDGPALGIGYSMRIYLLNGAGERLGTLFALGKRNIEANDPDKEDLDYYLFVDLTEEWVVSAPPVKTAPAPAAVNLTSPAVWDEPLHNAMEFCAYRSLQLLASQFTR